MALRGGREHKLDPHRELVRSARVALGAEDEGNCVI